MRPLTAPELQAWLADARRPPPQLVDVRENWEVALCGLPGALHVPMGEVAARIGELDAGRETVVVCHHGVRSYHVCLYLSRQGFSRLWNLEGGIDAWARQVAPDMATY